MGLKPMEEVLKGNRQRWFEHVLRKDPDDWVRKCMDYEAIEEWPRRWPEKNWKALLEKDYYREDCHEGIPSMERGGEKAFVATANAYPCISGVCGQKRMCVNCMLGLCWNGYDMVRSHILSNILWDNKWPRNTRGRPSANNVWTMLSDRSHIILCVALH